MPEAPPIAHQQRDHYIDRLRTTITALVILHHTAITYGGSGGWFWREHSTDGSPSSILLTLFCATNQAWFMGFFFFLAGYYTPASLNKKGPAAFLRDRFCRLGLPLLAFIFLLGPLTAAIANQGDGGPFWATFPSLWHRARIINGPLWFAQALLLFSIGYLAWNLRTRPNISQPLRDDRPIPKPIHWIVAALALAVASFLTRLIIPVGQNYFGLQLGYFPAYIFLFAVGIAAWRHHWLNRLQWLTARPWLITSALVWPTLPLALILAKSGGSKPNFSGGTSWPAILYDLWEPFLAWGILCLWLLFFRDHLNRPSRLWDWLNRRAYAVYILHPPILVSLALLLHPWAAPPLIKFLVTGTLSIAACWLLSDPLVRLPGLRRIL